MLSEEIDVPIFIEKMTSKLKHTKLLNKNKTNKNAPEQAADFNIAQIVASDNAILVNSDKLDLGVDTVNGKCHWPRTGVSTIPT